MSVLGDPARHSLLQAQPILAPPTVPISQGTRTIPEIVLTSSKKHQVPPSVPTHIIRNPTPVPTQPGLPDSMGSAIATPIDLRPPEMPEPEEESRGCGALPIT